MLILDFNLDGISIVVTAKKRLSLFSDLALLVRMASPQKIFNTSQLHVSKPKVNQNQSENNPLNQLDVNLSLWSLLLLSWLAFHLCIVRMMSKATFFGKTELLRRRLFEKNDNANEFAKEENLLYKANVFWNEKIHLVSSLLSSFRNPKERLTCQAETMV